MSLDKISKFNGSEDKEMDFRINRLGRSGSALITIAIILFTLFGHSYAQRWSEPVAISANSAEDKNPTISKALFDGWYPHDIWITWESNRDGNWNIYGSYSPEFDTEWSSPIQLTSDSTDDRSPALFTDFEGTWLAWESFREGNWNIYVNRFENGEWLGSIRVTEDEAEDRNPVLRVDYQTVWLAWESKRNGNWDIYTSYIENGNWTIPVQVTLDTNNDLHPSIKPEGEIMVVFESNRDGDWNIYSKIYNDTNWTFLRVVTTEIGEDRSPDLADDGAGSPVVVWQSDREGDFNIYYSEFYLGEWKEYEVVTNVQGADIMPVIIGFPIPVSRRQFFGNCIGWSSNRDGNLNIYALEGPITLDLGDDTAPAVGVRQRGDQMSEYETWIAWESNRDGNLNIYASCKLYTFDDVININKNSSISSFKLYQNHPNPLNSSTAINYQLYQKIYVILNIYDINGQKIRTIVDALKNPGYHVVIWDAKDYQRKDVESGIYFYQLKAGEYFMTKKFVVLR